MKKIINLIVLICLISFSLLYLSSDSSVSSANKISLEFMNSSCTPPSQEPQPKRQVRLNIDNPDYDFVNALISSPSNKNKGTFDGAFSFSSSDPEKHLFLAEKGIYKYEVSIYKIKRTVVKSIKNGKAVSETIESNHLVASKSGSINVVPCS